MNPRIFRSSPKFKCYVYELYIYTYIYIHLSFIYFKGLQHCNKLRLFQDVSADVSASLPPSAPVEVDKVTSEKLKVCLGQGLWHLIRTI